MGNRIQHEMYHSRQFVYRLRISTPTGELMWAAGGLQKLLRFASFPAAVSIDEPPPGRGRRNAGAWNTPC